MTALKDRLIKLIAASGPMSIADYMATCLFDPQHGYYSTREPFGKEGDFTTAPEVSQMFGELIAVWALQAWKAAGSPSPFIFAEIGPGRGTLMADMARTLARIGGDFLGAAHVVMIETSPRLTAVQQERLASSPVQPTWQANMADLPKQPLIIVGNELFDAIPLRQFVKTGTEWRERVVTTNGSELAFAVGAAVLSQSGLPEAPEGAVIEIAPAREALMEVIADHIAGHGGAGLFIDYGHLEPGIGDTLQAIRGHAYDAPLAHPGEADLTAHVDFSSLAAIARAHGLEAHLTTQGACLLELGLLERAGRLGAGRDADTQERVRGEVERLAGPDQMGALFKVLSVHRT